MRKINPPDFRVARRGTSSEINRQIALNLIRAHQPISRADLARLMNVRRGVASLLLSESLIFEGAPDEAFGRGRRPTAEGGLVRPGMSDYLPAPYARPCDRSSSSLLCQ